MCDYLKRLGSSKAKPKSISTNSFDYIFDSIDDDDKKKPTAVFYGNDSTCFDIVFQHIKQVT